MTSVNVTTTKNTVTVTEGDTRIVTITTAGPQGPAFTDGDIGDIVISGGGTVATIDAGVINNAKVASDAAIAGSKLQASSGSNSGTMSAADFTKLAGVETGATADQTASEIKTLLNSDGLTNSQISGSAAIAGTKISPDFGSQNITSTGNISANAVSGASFSGNGASITNINAANIASGQIASARVPTLNQNTTGSAATLTTARTIAGVSFDGSANIDISYANLTNKLTVGDGGLTQNNFTNTLKTKLDGVEAGATADQTAAEILTLLSDQNIATTGTLGSGDITITGSQPALKFIDDGTNPDYNLYNNNGVLRLYDITNAADRLVVNTDGHIDVKGNLDCEAGLDVTGDLTVSGNMTVSGTTTTIDTTTLTVEDKNIELGKVSTPTDTTADGGGITLKGATDKTFNWIDATDSWTSSEHIALGDQKKLKLGNSQDLLLHHDGSHSKLHTETGNLSLSSPNKVQLSNATGDGGSNYENMVQAIANGGVELYFDNVKRLETTSTGNKSTGTFEFLHSSGAARAKITSDGNYKNEDGIKFISGTGNDLQIYHDGSNSIINNATNILRVRSDHLLLSKENNIRYLQGNSGVVELFYDNAVKLTTTSTGVSVTGGITATSHITLPDDVRLKVGTGEDLHIYHNQSNSVIREEGTGNLNIQTTGGNVEILTNTTETSAKFISNGAVELYYDNVKTFFTTSHGIQVQGASGGLGQITLSADANEDNADKFKLVVEDNGPFKIQNRASATWETNIECNGNGNVELYYDNVKKFETTSIGCKITDSGANTALQFANDNGFNGYVFANSTNEIGFKDNATHWLVRAIKDGAVEAYYDNVKRLETTSTGIDVTGSSTFAQQKLKTSDGTNRGGLYADNTDTLYLLDGQDHQFIQMVKDGQVIIKHDNSNILRTYSSGVQIFGALFADSVDLDDNKKILLGTGDDLEIYHDGSNSYLDNTGTGDFYIRGNNVNSIILRPKQDENSIIANSNGDVELYYDHSKKLETTSTGVSITGNITASGGQLTLEDGNEEQIHRFWSSSSDSDIYGLLSGSTFGTIVEGANNGHHVIGLRGNDTSDSFAIISGGGNYATDSTYDTLVARFYSNGVFHMPDNNSIKLGTGNDLQIYHDGSNSFLKDAGTGSLKILSNQTQIIDANNSENIANFNENGNVELYFDNSKKFRTYTGGVIGDENIWVGSDNYKLLVGGSADLQIYHDGSNSYLVNTTGELRITDSSLIRVNTDDFRIYKGDGTELTFRAEGDGATTLYYDNSKKLETTSTGVTVTGDLLVGPLDAEVKAGGFYFSNNIGSAMSSEGIRRPTTHCIAFDTDSTERMRLSSGNLGIGTQTPRRHFHIHETASATVGMMLTNGATGQSNDGQGFQFKVGSDGTANIDQRENKDIIFLTNASERMRITSDANVQIPNDSGKLQLGASQDLAIYHDGTKNYLKSGAYTNTEIWSDVFFVKSVTGSGEAIIKGSEGGAVELYYDNSKKFETHASGCIFTGSLFGLDNQKIELGHGNDLQIYHDGTDSIIEDAGTGKLVLKGSTKVEIRGSNGEDLAVFEENGNVELYYDGSLKAETRSDGFEIKQHLTMGDSDEIRLGNSGDLKIYHDGVNSHIKNATGHLIFKSDNFQFKDKESGDEMVKMLHDGAVEIYYDNSKKFETDANGAEVLGNRLRLSDNVKLACGAGADLEIYHDATRSYIKNETDELRLLSNTTRLSNEANNETYIFCVNNGKVDLKYDNSTKLETTSTGIQVTGNIVQGSNAYIDMGAGDLYTDDNGKIRLGTSSDLEIYHNGTNNYLDSSNGHIYLRLNVSASSQENAIKCTQNGNVEISYDGTKKLETTSSGVTVTGTVTETSDIALKSNIKPLNNALEKIKQITGYKYNLNSQASMGVIAQDVEKVFPELVHGFEGKKSLQYSGLIGVLVEAVKELSAKVAELEAA